MLDETTSPTFSPLISSDLSPLSRRKAMSLIGAIGSTILASSSSASAFLFRKPANPSVNFDDLPHQWVDIQGRTLTSYVDYIASLNLEKITTHQIISAHAKQKGSVWNTLPPQNMWKNIGGTLKAIDKIGKELNMPIKEIVSVYRSPAYNARCPGAKRSSWHQSNFAVDVTFPTRASVITRTARSMRNQGLFRGGVGGYYGFTHIDTRGQNVDW